MTVPAERESWDDYFLKIARVVSSRATCPRAMVGAIIVRDKRIVATGYNGSLSGEPHCTEEGCLIVNDHCQRAIHAETNAVAQAAKLGTSIEGATLYVWVAPDRPIAPCVKCLQVMKAAGIARLVSIDGDENLWKMQ